MPITQVDPTKVLTGADGVLFAGAPGSPTVELAHVDEFEMAGSFQNADLHPVGQRITFAIPVSQMYRVTLSEPIMLPMDGAVNVDFLTNLLHQGIGSGCPIMFSFAGYVLEPCAVGGAAKQAKHAVYLKYCVPDGEISFMGIRPGEIIRRRWSFRVNSVPTF